MRKHKPGHTKKRPYGEDRQESQTKMEAERAQPRAWDQAWPGAEPTEALGPRVMASVRPILERGWVQLQAYRLSQYPVVLNTCRAEGTHICSSLWTAGSNTLRALSTL